MERIKLFLRILWGFILMILDEVSGLLKKSGKIENIVVNYYIFDSNEKKSLEVFIPPEIEFSELYSYLANEIAIKEGVKYRWLIAIDSVSFI